MKSVSLSAELIQSMQEGITLKCRLWTDRPTMTDQKKPNGTTCCQLTWCPDDESLSFHREGEVDEQSCPHATGPLLVDRKSLLAFGNNLSKASNKIGLEEKGGGNSWQKLILLYQPQNRSTI